MILMRDGRFQKGQHWRSPQLWWSKKWLENEYIEQEKSAKEIALTYGCGENNIFYWLHRHNIRRRTMSEIRSIKHWGAVGSANPMHGRRGVLNPNWRGGFTPFRQSVYCSSEWQVFQRRIRTRDKSCKVCKSKENLELHYIEPVSQAPLLIMDAGNALLLCRKCHGRLLGRERRWRKRLLALLKETSGRVEQ